LTAGAGFGTPVGCAGDRDGAAVGCGAGRAGEETAAGEVAGGNPTAGMDGGADPGATDPVDLPAGEVCTDGEVGPSSGGTTEPAEGAPLEVCRGFGTADCELLEGDLETSIAGAGARYA